MNDLSDRGSFVILGATGSIGSAVARDLARRGAALVLVGRDQVRLHDLARELSARDAVLPDLRPATIRRVLTEACADRPVAGIAHCIGSLFLGPAHRTEVEQWEEVIATNLTSAFGVVGAVPDLMRDGGAVVFVSSVAANVGLANHEAIAAAKAGLIGLARAAAATHARRRVRFHCVAPALVRSRMTAGLLARAGVAEAAAKLNPMGRIGEPEDIARAIVFLLDPANEWIDAQVLGVDGGFAALR